MPKLKYEDVKLEVESEGWQLLSDSYTNLKTQMEFKCPNDHHNFFTLSHWRNHKVCPVCKANKYCQTTSDAATLKRKNTERILAFDQATIISGWSVFDNNELVRYGFKDSNGGNSVERISKTKQWVASMIQQWRPDIVVFEDIQLQSINGNEAVMTYKKLAHLQGVLENYCYESRIPFKVVPPATWRSANKIKSRNRTDQKKNAQILVKQLYDVNVSQDEADAILIGRWAVEESKKNQIIKF